MHYTYQLQAQWLSKAEELGSQVPCRRTPFSVLCGSIQNLQKSTLRPTQSVMLGTPHNSRTDRQVDDSGNQCVIVQASCMELLRVDLHNLVMHLHLLCRWLTVVDHNGRSIVSKSRGLPNLPASRHLAGSPLPDPNPYKWSSQGGWKH